MSTVFPAFAIIPDATSTRPATEQNDLRLGAILDLLKPERQGNAFTLKEALTNLDKLRSNVNRDGYIFRPTPYAHEHARDWTIIAFSRANAGVPAPDFIPDGEGGIDIEWMNGEREVTLSCRARPTLKGNYIYWQDADEYDAKGVSIFLLTDRLNWLTDSTR